MKNQTNRRWRAEWEQHKATWMAWPCRQEIWTHGIEKAQHAFAEVANTISEFEPVHMLIRAEDAAVAQKLLSSDIELHFYALDDSWARDIAPLWIDEALNDGKSSSSKPLALDFLFNAWGNKFTPYAHDAKVADHITQLTQTKREAHDFVLEGGAIHGNGAGTLLTTEECLLHQNRNPKLDKNTIEERLLQAFGAKDVIWLKNGLAGDVDTDGHIDNIACFVDEKTIITQSTADTHSENHTIYADNKAIIKGCGLELIEIAEPEPRFSDGVRVPLSYINYYIANDLVVLPSFGCKQDEQAFSVMKDLYPSRQVKQIDANEILVGGGGIHCITMQQPLI
ncbi:agmatine deiminase family protein [Kangiella japonica]|uniref:Agmatine deiminase family protein n=1 Tax=Kangiella japonica TaxID=647384 RepID=A0ABN0T550_9GAMM